MRSLFWSISLWLYFEPLWCQMDFLIPFELSFPRRHPFLLQKILLFFELSIWIEASEWWWYHSYMMKSLFVFPAQWYPTQPYLSTPYLCAYLREKGWDVTQRDFNIESYDHFLSPTLLENILSKIEGHLTKLKEKSR